MDLDRLLKLGGSRWREYGYDRIYFNDLLKLLKLQLKIDNNTYPAKRSYLLDGEFIENDVATKIQSAVSHAKFWYDVKIGRFDTSHLYCKGVNLKQMLIDSVIDNDNEFTEILSDLDDI